MYSVQAHSQHDITCTRFIHATGPCQVSGKLTVTDDVTKWADDRTTQQRNALVHCQYAAEKQDRTFYSTHTNHHYRLTKYLFYILHGTFLFLLLLSVSRRFGFLENLHSLRSCP